MKENKEWFILYTEVHIISNIDSEGWLVKSDHDTEVGAIDEMVRLSKCNGYYDIHGPYKFKQNQQ